MDKKSLADEIRIELENLRILVDEIQKLRKELGDSEPSLRDKTVLATFLAQFYNGVENILKRISRYHGTSLPIGELWHIELFKRFCNPPYSPLPLIFDASLEKEFTALRKFRHVVHHGYAFQLEWDNMRAGVESIEGIFDGFTMRVKNYLGNEADGE